jgi:hypothetical protein
MRFIIKDVPVGVCQECGERYYEATTLDQLDAIAQEGESASERISVPIMAFVPEHGSKMSGNLGV